MRGHQSAFHSINEIIITPNFVKKIFGDLIGENKLVNWCHEQDTTDATTKGTAAKAVKVTIITSENNNDAGNSAISL